MSKAAKNQESQDLAEFDAPVEAAKNLDQDALIDAAREAVALDAPVSEVVSLDSEVDVLPDPYPEHTKLTAISHESQKLYDFVEWLGNTKKIFLGETFKKNGRSGSEVFSYTNTSIRSLLAEYFKIDEVVLAKEKDAMLEAIRKHTETQA